MDQPGFNIHFFFTFKEFILNEWKICLYLFLKYDLFDSTEKLLKLALFCVMKNLCAYYEVICNQNQLVTAACVCT